MLKQYHHQDVQILSNNCSLLVYSHPGWMCMCLFNWWDDWSKKGSKKAAQEKRFQMTAPDVLSFLFCAADEATACLKPEKLPVTKINWKDIWLWNYTKKFRDSHYNCSGVSQLTVAESLGADSNQQNLHQRGPESLSKVGEHVNN